MKTELNKERLNLSYQSNYFDLFIQYYFDISVILFNNDISGLIFKKTIFYFNEEEEIKIGYGVFLNLTLLGFRFAIYIVLFSFTKKQYLK